MQQFNARVSFVTFAVFCAIMHISHALDCKELHSKKEEIMGCCSAQHLVPMDGLHECFEEHKDKDKRDMIGCAFRCFFDKHDLMDGDEVSEEKLLAKADELEGDWKDVNIQAIKDCTAMIAEMKAKHGGDAHKGECPPSAAFMNMCLGKAFFKNCPEDKWTDSDVCSMVKSGECEPKRGGHHH